jgi:hypothetical protein
MRKRFVGRVEVYAHPLPPSSGDEIIRPFTTSQFGFTHGRGNFVCLLSPSELHNHNTDQSDILPSFQG